MSGNGHLVSIIIPVYNIVTIKKIFCSAVQSVLKQTYPYLELLLINDGSSDTTKSILEGLEKRDSRITVINKENGGIESARRKGLELAKGEFLFHMDQDDLLEINALKKLVESAEKSQADVVMGECCRFWKNKKIVLPTSKKINDDLVIDQEKFLGEYYKGFFGISCFPVQIWNKLYRKSFIDSVPVPRTTGFYNEDLNYNMNILPHAKKLCGFQILHITIVGEDLPVRGLNKWKR